MDLSYNDLNEFFYHAEENQILYKEKFESERQTTLDDFEIKSIIGQGGFGKVFLVMNKRDNKYYAMK